LQVPLGDAGQLVVAALAQGQLDGGAGEAEPDAGMGGRDFPCLQVIPDADRDLAHCQASWPGSSTRSATPGASGSTGGRLAFGPSPRSNRRTLRGLMSVSTTLVSVRKLPVGSSPMNLTAAVARSKVRVRR